MKLNELYKQYNVLQESDSRNDMVLSYHLNISVDDGKFKAKGDGTIRIPEEEYSNTIISIEDVINYIITMESKKSHTVNHSGVDSKEILAQMLFAFMDVNNSKYLTVSDEIQFSFDYGPSDTNCIGLLITKAIGSPSFSIVMRMNKKSLTNSFNKEAMDARILSYSSSGTDK